MPGKQTQNYNLSQWVKTDQVLMDDFNADNLAIDKAIKAQADALAAEKTARESAVAAEKTARETAMSADKSELTSMITLRNCRIESTSYTGDTASNTASSRTIKFSKRPVVFFVFGNGCMLMGAGSGTKQRPVLRKSHVHDDDPPVGRQ